MVLISPAYQPLGGRPTRLERLSTMLRTRRLHSLVAACFLLVLISLTPAATYDNVAAHVTKLHSDAAALAPWLAGSGAARDTATRWPKCKPTQGMPHSVAEEREHSVAYLFMVHTEETLESARQTIEHLWHPDDLFVVHADAKMNDSLVARYRDSMGVCGNVQLIDEERVDVQWGKWVRRRSGPLSSPSRPASSRCFLC